MKLTNQDIEILQNLLEDKLKEIEMSPEDIKSLEKPEVYIDIIKKLDQIYFS